MRRAAPPARWWRFDGTKRGCSGPCPAGPISTDMANDDVTELLERWNRGDKRAREQVFERLYTTLHELARANFARERLGHTLQPTALVHEAYLRLLGSRGANWRNRTHFLAAAANTMRRILVDHARRRASLKRGGDAITVSLSLEPALHAASKRVGNVDLIALSDALDELHTFSPRQSTIIELRHVIGLTVDETATALNIATTTVIRKSKTARAWLFAKLNPE